MPQRLGPPQGWQRSLVMAVLFVALVHSAVIGLWLMPDNAVRSAVGDDRVTAYVDPYFQQSWADLEPTLQRVDETLELRAVVSRSGERVTTEWIDLVEIDLRRAPVGPRSDRSADLTRHLAVNLNQSILNLPEENRTVIAEDGSGGEVRDALVDAGVRSQAADTYTVVEQTVVEFAGLYAEAHWDARVLWVQVRPGMRVLPEDRSVASTDQDMRTWDIGWREAGTISPDARRSFAAYVEDRIER